ncbi:MAG: Trk system potassium transporter TrkA [Acidobacteria bacterium]|nr:Trk system potassium transporter TrkA [Acidobacteriota bacterium]
MRILIAGGGQAASLVATRLIREGNEVVLVEQDPERCHLLEETLDAKVVQGNAASIRTLHEADIGNAEMLIALTSEDQINVLVCLIASVESDVKFKVARLRTHEVNYWRRILRRAGLHIDLIIHPETEIADRILRVVRLPGVSDVIDFAEGRVKLFGMNIDEKSWVAYKTVEDLDRAGPPKNSLIALIFRGQQVIVPHGAEVLKPGDHVYIVTTADDLERVCQFMGLQTQESLDRVYIVGGKQVGIRVAELLEPRGVTVKLFERDIARCERISQILRKTVVLHADGTDESILAEENIEGAGAFLAMTNDDEDNLIASLLARKLGAKKVVALINRLNYLPMAQRLGINTTVSPRLAAVDRILQFVRKGRVLSVTTFREEEAEAIELIAAEGSKYVGRSLREVRLPRGAIVGAIARPNGEVVVPRGEATIQAGDRVIFCTLENTVPLLESAFLAEARREWV